VANIPIGYLISTLLLGCWTWWAVMPRRRSGILAPVSVYFGQIINELPLLALLWLLATTLLAWLQGDLRSPGGWIAVGLALLTAIGLVVVAWHGFRAILITRQALAEGLGSGWRDVIGTTRAAQIDPSFRLAALLGPFFRRGWGIERVANIRYGDDDAFNLLDLYRARSHPTNAPVLIHFHGGAMVGGKKNREALPLISRLARHGWICISANYRLSPAAAFPAQLIDAKKVIAWVRVHGKECGIDPSCVFVAGGSSGGQLAAQAALTANVPELQPGFEELDTSVTAAIPLYGYYGWMHEGFLKQYEPSSPAGEMPPFFVVHGDRDRVLPVEDAREFVKMLRVQSPNPVVYVELPGAQHNYDLFHSIRSEAVIDGIEAFATWVRAQ
jgi:acetyl esterase/lipase